MFVKYLYPFTLILGNIFASGDLAKNLSEKDVCCIPPSTPQEIANLTKEELEIVGNINTAWFDIGVFINFRNTNLNVPKLKRIDLTKSDIHKEGLKIILDVLRKSCSRSRESPELTFKLNSTQYEQLFSGDSELKEKALKANLFFLIME